MFIDGLVEEFLVLFYILFRNMLRTVIIAIFPFFQNKFWEKSLVMTSLKKRLDNILNEISIIGREINVSGHSPPCCLVFHENDRISCDVLGPLPKEQFFQECSKCKARIKRLVDCINIEKRGN